MSTIPDVLHEEGNYASLPDSLARIRTFDDDKRQLRDESEASARAMLDYWRKHGRVFWPMRTQVSLAVQRACAQIGRDWQRGRA